MRRTVKKACSKDGKLASLRIHGLPPLLQSFGGRSQQFRRAGQIPVRISNVGMSQIGRQDRQPAFGVFTGSVPAQQGLHGETVPKIMEARSMTCIHST